jgi:hypothetical protein
MPPLITPAALARTYNHPSKDPWDAVELYREAMTYSDDWGAQRVASAINSDESNEFEGISRGEVRAWVDGDSKPDAARAVDVARELGWDADEWTDTVRALATLVIGLYAFGSITERNYSASWSPGHPESEAVVETALDTVGVGYRHVERDDPGQADEIKPQQHATRLGRALVVAGAPRGGKNADSVHALPEWVAEAPVIVKIDLAVLLVRDRAIRYPDKATARIQSDRGARYFEDVAALIREVTGESVTASDSGVTISADAVRELGLD